MNEAFDRRKFLQIGSAAAVGVGIIGWGVEHMLNFEPVRDFSTARVDYRFIGGPHDSAQIEGKPLKVEYIPENTTVFELESGTLPYLNPNYYPDLGLIYKHGAASIEFFGGVMPELTKRKLPLVLVDIPPMTPDPELMFVVASPLLSGIDLAALWKREKNLKRRKFLFLGIMSVLSLVGLRAISNTFVEYLYKGASEPWAQQLAQINHFVELSKPDSLAITFRNSIIAAKTIGLEDQFHQSSQTNRPRGLLMYGAGHWGLPEYFVAGKKPILDYLSGYPEQFIDKIFGEGNPHLYTSVIITPEENDLKIRKVEDEDLKKLFS